MKIYYALIAFFVVSVSFAERTFVHPGISHKRSDLERMKLQVEAGEDPWLATYNTLPEDSNSRYTYTVRGDSSHTTITNLRTFEADGNAAYFNALMWSITGDQRHAQKSVEIFNAWANITRIENQFALSNGGALWRMVEAAEIIKHTYDGWDEGDIEKFKAMLVYPGWSGTEVPADAIRSKDCSFYWNIYQGDPGRHGNQGLFGYRSLMAMGIFCDHEVIYERALRYLKGEPHRPDDLPYPSGPPVLSDRLDSSNEYYDEFRQLRRETRQEDYGYNEVMANYIYENGQSQESARDQAHGLGGVSIITSMGEMAWNQGDNLYGHLNNRPLLGLEFYLRYNLSYEHAFPDQLTPWEPTVESGEFIERSDRSGRWNALKMNPWTAADLMKRNRGLHNLNPIYEMNLGHYRDRMLLDPSNYKWLERGFDVMTDALGVEDGAHPGSHPGYGGLKFRRVSPGDPLHGFDAHGLPVYGMNMVPCTIEAENYDYFPISGNGRTYYDSTEGNQYKTYRTDDVDIVALPDGGFALTQMVADEWLTYTVSVPEAGNYDVAIRYAAREEGAVQLSFKNDVSTDNIILPVTEGTSWATHVVGRTMPLTQGVQQMKLMVTEGKAAYILDHVSIQSTPVDIPLTSTKIEPPVVVEEPKIVPTKEPPPSTVQHAPTAEKMLKDQ